MSDDKIFENTAEYNFELNLQMHEEFLPFISNAIIVNSNNTENWNSDSGDEVFAFPVGVNFDEYNMSVPATRYQDYIEVYGDGTLLYAGVPYYGGYASEDTTEEFPNLYWKEYFSATIVFTCSGHGKFRSGGRPDRETPGLPITLTDGPTLFIWRNEHWEQYYDSVIQPHTITITSGGFTVNGGDQDAFDGAVSIVTEESSVRSAGFRAFWNSYASEYAESHPEAESGMLFACNRGLKETDLYALDLNIPNTSSHNTNPPLGFSTIVFRRNNPSPLVSSTAISIPSSLVSPKLCFFAQNKTYNESDKFRMLVAGAVYKKAPIAINSILYGQYYFSEVAAITISVYNDTYSHVVTLTGYNGIGEPDYSHTYTRTSNHTTQQITGSKSAGNDLQCKLISKICPPNTYREDKKYGH